jgi:hypothetical protein
MPTEIKMYDAAIIDDEEAMEAAVNQDTDNLLTNMLNGTKCEEYRIHLSNVTRRVANEMMDLARTAYKHNLEKYEYDAMCKKCGGKGHIDCYKHVEGGTCFRCGGDGISPANTTRKPGRPDYEAITAVAAKVVGKELL